MPILQAVSQQTTGEAAADAGRKKVLLLAVTRPYRQVHV